MSFHRTFAALAFPDAKVSAPVLRPYFHSLLYSYQTVLLPAVWQKLPDRCYMMNHCNSVHFHYIANRRNPALLCHTVDLHNSAHFRCTVNLHNPADFRYNVDLHNPADFRYTVDLHNSVRSAYRYYNSLRPAGILPIPRSCLVCSNCTPNRQYQDQVQASRQDHLLSQSLHR